MPGETASVQREEIGGARYTIRIHPASEIGDLMDHYREVEVLIEGGNRYRGVFFPDPLQGRGPNGTLFWYDPTMILIDSLSESRVLEAVREIIRRDAIPEAMEVID